jgi:hypothetical protein
LPISIAMVALSEGATLSATDIQRDLKFTWPLLPKATGTEEKDTAIAFRVGAADVILGRKPPPIPWSDLEGPCATSWLWPDAANVLREHNEHLIVTVSGELNALKRARLLTQVIASVLSTCKGAVGVYWGDATFVISPPVFRDFAVQMAQDGWPLYVWVDFRVGRNQQGGCSGFTTGLSALGHMEFETLNSPEKPGELRERLFGLACYVLQNGPVIKDGDTVGEDANERIRVEYSASYFGHRNRVMRLNYSHAAPQKPWWKLW